MKLLLKFNLIFLAVFGLGLVATGYTAHRFLTGNARDQVLQQARLMMETTLASRTYTTKQIRPLLEARQSKEHVFFAQSVPAYAATQVFTFLRGKFSDYAYKEATLNPTNPQDRAVDWEVDVINLFRNDANMAEFVGERDTPSGRSLFLAMPINVAQSCLPCHSTPQAAPAEMLKAYGPNNGFGWKLGEIIAAQIVSVPMSVPLSIARKAFLNLMVWLAGIAIVSLVLLNISLIASVIRPVSLMSKAADEISKGNMETVELDVKGKDEIAVLAGSFNRMHRSLAKAMKMLDE